MKRKKGKRGKPRFTCSSGKLCFRSVKCAENVATQATKANLFNSSQHIPIRAYSCELCGKWHITHLDASVAAKLGILSPA